MDACLTQLPTEHGSHWRFGSFFLPFPTKLQTRHVDQKESRDVCSHEGRFRPSDAA